MENSEQTHVKICCIASAAEARAAIAAGASAIGLVSEMPSGPGVITEANIAEIAARVPPDTRTFLLTSRQDSEGIILQQKRTGVNTIQICDRLPPDAYSVLRENLPGITLVQVVHITGPESVEEAVAIAPFVDAILLDSGNQNLAVKELGGTGRVHDWNLSRRIVESVLVPVFLAGGLNAENVGAAIRQVRSYGVDICSGVRTNGDLDPAKLIRFVAAVRQADAGNETHG